MLEILGASFMGLLMEILGQAPPLPRVERLSWQEVALFQLPTEPDPDAEAIVQQYLQDLAAQGIPVNSQGVWLQSGVSRLATHQGNIPLSAASLTKIATSIAALEKWGPEHTFDTQIYATGPIAEGTLQGDLVVVGGGNPLFVWEEAIAVGNALNQLGIETVTGNLILVGDFWMNYQSNPITAGQFLRQGLNGARWSSEVETAYKTLPEGTQRPQVAIAGSVQVKDQLPDNTTQLLTHRSLTLAQILKQMNIYSNNPMAEMLANSVGGPQIVSELAAKGANVPSSEIQLINGSGLGVANRISPHAATAMLIGIDYYLRDQPLRVTDLFPVSGQDSKGTMKARNIPTGAAVKTGTLWQVSALAGVLPTRDRGDIWFAIINNGSSNIEQLRQQQDQLLQRIAEKWELAPSAVTANPNENGSLGDSRRITRIETVKMKLD